jgi:UDPglucose 6-dehydrogenase
MATAAQSARDVTWCEDSYDAAKGADAAVIMTEWEVFRRIDLPRLAKALRQPLLMDFRNLYKPQAAAAAGLTYVSVGRAAAKAGS